MKSNVHDSIFMVLARLIVLYPGTKRFPVTEQVEAVHFATIATGKPLFA